MWCRQCQQDVPGIGCANTGDYSCPRCGVIISTPADPPLAEPSSDRADSEARSPSAGKTAPPLGPEPPPCYDGWELEEQLRHIERILAVRKPADKPARAAERSRPVRLDAAHAGTATWHLPLSRETHPERIPAAKNAAPRLPLLTWSALLVGLMAFACGGVLLGWSIVVGREDLWTLGMPIAIGGQILLLIGLILQLDRLWHDNRSTATKLDHVDQRIDDLKTTTSLLGTTHGPAAGAFYSHLAGGANAQLLLADLKSQLDLLALRISQTEP